MTPDIETIKRCAAILDANAVPKGKRMAWMTKSMFLALGGTIEHWNKVEGDDDGPKLIHG